MTCVGAWVVTKWLVSCLGNSQIITRSCLKLVNLPPINCCVWWHVSCRGRKLTIQLRPTLLHKSPQAAADKKSAKKSCKGWVRGVRHFTYKTLTCKCECLPHNTLHLVSTLQGTHPPFFIYLTKVTFRTLQCASELTLLVFCKWNAETLPLNCNVLCHSLLHRAWRRLSVASWYIYRSSLS